jgi:uncharacterized protein (DUF736 family)
MENNDKPKLEEAGAFWVKTSKTGTQFLTGKVKSKSGEEISVMVFKNKYKTEGSNQPDYRIYYDNNQNKNNVPSSKSEEVAVNKPKKQSKSEEPEKVKQTEEIPF